MADNEENVEGTEEVAEEELEPVEIQTNVFLTDDENALMETNDQALIAKLEGLGWVREDELTEDGLTSLEGPANVVEFSGRAQARAERAANMTEADRAELAARLQAGKAAKRGDAPVKEKAAPKASAKAAAKPAAKTTTKAAGSKRVAVSRK